jgi:hypothetical protein
MRARRNLCAIPATCPLCCRGNQRLVLERRSTVPVAESFSAECTYCGATLVLTALLPPGVPIGVPPPRKARVP